MLKTFRRAVAIIKELQKEIDNLPENGEEE